MTESTKLQYYLALTGPRTAAGSSVGTTQPWCVHAVYLFDAQRLRAEQEERGVKRGVASSVTAQQWAAAEIYPHGDGSPLPLTPRQRELLARMRTGTSSIGGRGGRWRPGRRPR
ncbi:hypothetical protein Airi02_011330 [Actinoallomurus iriomotensis]|uniref:Uncharacterized protein n=1 Tax=Actinoallomurus iriomotensis TaxID=478107 RepID=A0A9W6RX39_9ACTN|nr:hypothetical protein Airi02_011330 [Actinoallomurus iriomotensis]